MKQNKLMVGVIVVMTIAIVILATGWISSNAKPIKEAFNGVNLYEYADVEEAFDEGYESGSANADDLRKEIESLKANIDKLTITYNNNVEELNEEISEIKGQLFEANKLLTNANDSLALSNAELTRLQELLIVYEERLANSELNLCTFVFNDTILAARNVATGSVIGDAPIVNCATGERFSHWEINGYKVDDINQFVVESDLKIVAIVIKQIEVTYYTPSLAGNPTRPYYGFGGTTQETLIVDYGSIVEDRAPLSTLEGWTFVGWATDYINPEIIDMSTFVADESNCLPGFANDPMKKINLFAIYEEIEEEE